MTETERVESIRDLLKFNKKTFSEVLGYTHPQNYTKYLNGTSSLSAKAMRALVEYDSRFNLNWILTGQGQMLLNNDSSNQQKIINGDANHAQIGDNNNNTINSNNNSNTKEIEYLKKEIELLKQSLKDKERLIAIFEKNQK